MVEESGVPILFRCPISLDLFTDPVTLSTGQTYDRPSIERWLAGGHSTCPVTMQRLEDASFVPNHTLRQLIDQWLLHGVDRRQSPLSVGIAASLVVLKTILQSSETPLSAMRDLLRKVRILSADSEIGNSLLIRLGFFPILLQVAFGPEREANSEIFELALSCILNLSPSIHLKCFNLLKQDEIFSSLVTVFEQGNLGMKTSLCLLMEIVTSGPSTREVSMLLGQSRTVLQVLISLLQSRVSEEAAGAAACALAGICSVEENIANAVREGAVNGLVCYLATGVRRNASVALGLLERLMRSEEGRRAAVKGGAVKVMVWWVFRASSGVKEASTRWRRWWRCAVCPRGRGRRRWRLV
ncbi:hypothetical protein HPP92_004478 [Vanilla planifolia]|uniref:U-box domain-containing protein n=1 Tax=Vanilla planifolia TaxID=51239 RepID=A0A835SA71_VANPL|nr:hypothetical protein HPP92_004478 [Vanilla planifolia]